MIQKQLRLKDKLFIGIVAVGLLIVIGNKLFGSDEQAVDTLLTLQVGEKKLKVELVDTPAAMYTGLSGRTQLPENQGMLFAHGQLGTHKYVMRGMNFGLDFVFIKENKVVDIAEDIQANFKGQIYGATEYDKVLEVNSGWVKKNEIKLGDEVKMAED